MKRIAYSIIAIIAVAFVMSAFLFFNFFLKIVGILIVSTGAVFLIIMIWDFLYGRNNNKN